MSEKMEEDDTLKALEPVGDAKIATGPGVAAIALTLAMKYHDINTVQDGALYQQYKIEGRNMAPLHIDVVFETAIRIERHLLGASDRIAKLVFDAITHGAEEGAFSNEGEESENNTTPARRDIEK